MKQKRMMAIAIASGVLCAVCVLAFMLHVQGQADAARTEALARYGGEQVEVCVATRDIAVGERVDAASVTTRMWIADLLPEGSVSASSDVVGKTATSSILKGEVVSAKRFEHDRDSLEVPADKMAVSVPAKAVRAVGGAIRPGMSVDVYSVGDSSATAIAYGVAVLDTSVGEGGSLVSSDAGWVTLAVAPEKVQEIVAASSRTDLCFVVPGEQASAQDASDGEEGSSEGGDGDEPTWLERADAQATSETPSDRAAAGSSGSASPASGASEEVSR